MKTALLTSAAGLQHNWIQEEAGFRLETVQDTTPILERNKAMAAHNDGYTASRDMRRVASIPLVLIYKWKNEEGWDAFNPAHADKLMAKLNSSEFAYLRTAEGRLGMSNGVMK